MSCEKLFVFQDLHVYYSLLSCANLGMEYNPCNAGVVVQPRSQGSLLSVPTERARERVGERTWERGWLWPFPYLLQSAGGSHASFHRFIENRSNFL